MLFNDRRDVGEPQGGHEMSVQDADLLRRLHAYLDTVEQRLQQGQGWLIFNSAQERGDRIVRLLLGRLNHYRPFFSFYHLPWRDFALHAYVSAVALPRDAPSVEGDGDDSRRRREFAIASSVADATTRQLTSADLVVLSNIAPAQPHEALALARTAVERAAGRRAIVALTRHDPWSLAAAFETADPSGTTWRHFYGVMRQTSLIAH